jgi:hypothetical protein
MVDVPGGAGHEPLIAGSVPMLKHAAADRNGACGPRSVGFCFISYQ